MLICIVDTETAQPGGAKPDPAADLLIDIAYVEVAVDGPRAVMIGANATLIEPARIGADPAIPWRTVDWLPVSLGDAAEHGSYADVAYIPGNVWLAHNAAYDAGIVERWISDDCEPPTWVCTYRQFRWLDRRGVTLPPCAQNELAARLGVPVQHAHRALGDCLTLLACLQTQPNPEQQIRDAMRRTLWVARLDVAREDAEKAGLVWQYDQRRVGLYMTPEEAANHNEDVHVVEWADPRPYNLRAGFERKDELRAMGCQWDPDARSWWATLTPGDVAAVPSWCVAQERT